MIASARREADERDARRDRERESRDGARDSRGRGRDSDRDRWDSSSSSHRNPPSNHHNHGIDASPQLYKIYTGKISNMRDFGCFVTLDNVRPQQGGKRWEGMVHVSSISSSRITNPQDVVSRGQQVYVKVLSVAGSRLSLSMKDVDQSTGRDLTPNLRVRTPEELAEEDRMRRERAKQRSGSTLGLGEEGGQAAPVRRKRISSPERFEIKQLIASGVLNPADYPDIDDEESGVLNYEEKEEELDIEIRDDEPAFLAGQARGAVQLSPVKIVKNPDGTLNRAAIQGAALAKDRRELKSQQAEAEMDVPRDLNQPWVDPMPDAGERTFAQDLKGFSIDPQKDIPEWKR
ncbi:DEAH-box ATP-dependent RNA helicase prp22, partial [Gonapodya sp. JEL0774]